jgi:hypothetical protein
MQDMRSRKLLQSETEMWPFSKKAKPANAPEHAMIVHTGPGVVTLDEVRIIEDELSDALKKDSVGEVDGHELELSGRDAIFYIYGPDADRMFATALPILRGQRATANGYATLRYGAPDDPKAASVEHLIASAH